MDYWGLDVKSSHKKVPEDRQQTALDSTRDGQQLF